MSSAGHKPVRKFPPPCWTRDEALVLIEAYRERWHALNRAFLRNPDWDAVAEKVTTACPDVTPPKTAAQCRHKMEKLRQRHRVEKQRAADFGERFLSTWFYYDAMEAMENGSSSEPGESNVRVKPVHEFANLAPVSTKQRTKPNPNLTNFGPRVSNRYNSFHSSNQDNDYEDQLLLEAPVEETLTPRARVRVSKNHKKGSIGGGVRFKPAATGQEESGSVGRPGLRPRKFSKVVHDYNDNDDNDDNEDDGEMWVKIPRSTNIPNRQMQNRRNEGDSSRKGRNLRSGGIGDVVESIRVLGEGFMKAEKMKMDIVREIEEMRMESEMKRNRLMLDSQKQIVDAFVAGLIECRKMTTTMGDV